MSDVPAADPVFDASLKKKKKKKTAPALGEDAVGGAGGSTTAAAAAEDPLDLSALPKKKKKKRKENAEGNPEGGDDDTNNANNANANANNDDGDEPIEGNLAELPKKKKKKKKKVADLDDEDEEDGGVDALAEATEGLTVEAGPSGDGPSGGSDAASLPWAGSDRDYTYGELSARIFSILEANNPELSDKTKVRMKPPQVVSSGSKRTAFVNFNDICKTMHRNPDHVMAFLLAELGTSASIDGNQRLLLKGRFQSKSIEAILKRYITEYVVCQGCKGPETTLSKDNRIYFVQCDNCGAKRSVSAISKGFQAQIGRRKDRRK